MFYKRIIKFKILAFWQIKMCMAWVCEGLNEFKISKFYFWLRVWRVVLGVMCGLKFNFGLITKIKIFAYFHSKNCEINFIF